MLWGYLLLTLFFNTIASLSFIRVDGKCVIEDKSLGPIIAPLKAATMHFPQSNLEFGIRAKEAIIELSNKT